MHYPIGQYDYMIGRMTKEDDELQSAIIDQLNAEMTVAKISMKALAATLGKPYDSTRNYLVKERAMPLGIFLEIAGVLDISPDEIITRARRRLR